MKVVHVCPMYLPSIGGAQTHIQMVSEGLAQRGHDVNVFTANASNLRDLTNGAHGELPHAEDINGVHVRRFQPDGGTIGSLIQWYSRRRGGYRSAGILFRDGLELVLQRPALLQIIPALIRSHADIVASAVWDFPPAYYTHLARRLKQFTLVAIPLFHTEELWSQRRVYRRMLALADVAIVNTSSEAEFIHSRCATRTEVIGVGVSPEAFLAGNGLQIRERYGLGNSQVIGFVGRQDVGKGTILLLQAMRSVWTINPTVRLVLAGPRYSRSQKVSSLIDSLAERERNNVALIDDFSEDEKASIYDSFDILALPSRAESFGIAYLEAWMCKKPVIGARIPATRCVINDGEDGILVDPNAPEDTTRAILELISHPERRKRMGEAGYRKVVSRFTWDRVVDKVEKLYTELVNNKGHC